MAQSALTMARGGVYNFVIAAVPAVLYAIKDGRLRARLIAVGVPAILIAIFIVIPRLDEMTDGALTERFQDTGTTGRTEIAMADIELWEKNPAFGVGAGMSPHLRSSHTGYNAHTEYSRLLAEHGSLGLVAILALGCMFVMALRKASSSEGKAIVAACAVWSLVCIGHSAMRLAAPSFLFGLSMMTLLPDEREAKSTEMTVETGRWPT
jgi:O-antigen ligase